VKSVRGQPGGQPVGGVGAAELVFGRLRRERPGRALASGRAVVATAAIADYVWTAADGTPLYRVTRAVNGDQNGDHAINYIILYYYYYYRCQSSRHLYILLEVLSLIYSSNVSQVNRDPQRQQHDAI